MEEPLWYESKDVRHRAAHQAGDTEIGGPLELHRPIPWELASGQLPTILGIERDVVLVEEDGRTVVHGVHGCTPGTRAKRTLLELVRVLEEHSLCTLCRHRETLQWHPVFDLVDHVEWVEHELSSMKLSQFPPRQLLEQRLTRGRPSMPAGSGPIIDEITRGVHASLDAVYDVLSGPDSEKLLLSIVVTFSFLARAFDVLTGLRHHAELLNALPMVRSTTTLESYQALLLDWLAHTRAEPACVTELEEAFKRIKAGHHRHQDVVVTRFDASDDASMLGLVQLFGPQPRTHLAGISVAGQLLLGKQFLTSKRGIALGELLGRGYSRERADELMETADVLTRDGTPWQEAVEIAANI